MDIRKVIFDDDFSYIHQSRHIDVPFADFYVGMIARLSILGGLIDV